VTTRDSEVTAETATGCGKDSRAVLPVSAALACASAPALLATVTYTVWPRQLAGNPSSATAVTFEELRTKCELMPD
jgi:hypothetical protein